MTRPLRPPNSPTTWAGLVFLVFSVSQDVELKGFNIIFTRVLPVAFFHRFSTYPSLDNLSSLPVSSHFRKTRSKI
jgi:hypothetical protein